MGEIDWQGKKDRLLYWPITSSLDHCTLCYFQDSTCHFFCFLAGDAQPGRGALNNCKLALTQTLTASNSLTCRRHLHISFHNVHNFRDCFRLLTRVRQWLAVRSRVNMQYRDSKVHYSAGSLFLFLFFLSTSLVVLLKLGDLIGNLLLFRMVHCASFLLLFQFCSHPLFGLNALLISDIQPLLRTLVWKYAEGKRPVD